MKMILWISNRGRGSDLWGRQDRAERKAVWPSFFRDLNGHAGLLSLSFFPRWTKGICYPLLWNIPSMREGNGNPLQDSCLENPRDKGAWWAAVYGVAQSWTRLKWLSSSSMLVITFLSWSKHLLISWLQSPLQWFWSPPKIKSVTVSIVSPSIAKKWWDKMTWS